MSTDASRMAEKLKGKFIVLDGPDGCGKSTQLDELSASLAKAGMEVVVCRDPGGTQVGDRIRSVLLDYDLSEMDVNCETLLFMASRAQLMAETIRPALDSGKTVLCARFVTSTCAYQGAAGLDPTRVIELARFAIGDCWPELTILLDVETEEGFRRIGRKPHHAGKNREKTAGEPMLIEGSTPDAMEARSMEFHRRVRKMFLQVHQYYPRPVITVDGRGSTHEVHERIMECLANVTL